MPYFSAYYYTKMNRFRNTNTVKIPYREGKISKQLTLNLDDENDARFYESYYKIPLDNRNYLASLYAREQERGVNDDVGQRLQDLALVTPKEDTTVLRENSKIELESLEETLKQREKRIAHLNALKSRGLTANEEAELTELEKIRDDIKRRIRNIKASLLKSKTADFISKNITNGPRPLTKNALLDSLEKVADNMSQNVVDFLEDKITQLPAKADGEEGSEQFVMTNAVYLAALCQLIPMDISKLGDNIKTLYALLNAIKDDTLTDTEYANRYEAAVDYVVDALHKFEKLHLERAFADGRLAVIVEEIKPVAASVESSLGRAVYKTYMDAAQLNLPNWRRIKDILDNSNNFEILVKNGKKQSSFRDTDRYKNSIIPFTVIYNGIRSAAGKIWSFWNKQKYPSEASAFKTISDTFNSGTYESNPKYDNPKGNTAPLRLNARYDKKSNELTITRIDVMGTRLKEPLNGVTFNNWLKAPKQEQTGTRGGKYYYDGTNLKENDFKSSAANAVLNALGMRNDGVMPQDILEKLTTKGAGIDMFIDDVDEAGAAQYRTFNSPEQQFHNIIDMGNPLKEIRSKYRRYR